MAGSSAACEEVDNRAGRIQAALVYYTAKFVHWSLPEGKELHLCSLAHDGVAQALPQTFLGKQIQGSSVQVRPILEPDFSVETLRGCHIVYRDETVTPSQQAILSEWIKANPQVVTICTVREVRANGCVIQIFEQQNKAKLAVDRNLLSQLGLRLSSEFLEVAGTVP